MKKPIVLYLILSSIILCGVSRAEEPKINDNDKTIKNILLADTPLSQVLFILEELTGKPILRDSQLVEVSINLQVKNAVDKEEAIRAIESALVINHIAIVELGDGLLKAVNTKIVPTQSPQFVEQSLLNEVATEKICSKIFQLRHLSVSEFSGLIKNLLNPDISSAIVFEKSNSMLITDSISTLQRIELILSKVDVPKHSIIDSKIFRIKHASASEITSLLNKVVNSRQGEITGFANEQEAIGGSKQPFQFSKDVTIEEDVRSNSIVVCGTQQDIERVGMIIDQLDVLLDQVRIEVVIAQVTLTKNQASGLDSFGFAYNFDSDSRSSSSSSSGSSGSSSSGEDWKHEPAMVATGSAAGALTPILTIGGNLKNFSINAVFNKAQSDSNVKVLSAPTIVTTHNREATVKIVDSIPIVTSDISDTASTALKSTIEYKDVGMELKVKPLIGVNGVIQMEIRQSVESKSETVKINGNEMPSTTKREAVSFVSVCDGDAVVLAGLQKKESARSTGKIWLLGDLPILGKALFSPKSHTEQTQELIVFIKPTIVSNPANEEAFAKRALKNSELKEEVENYNATGKFLPGMKMPPLTLLNPSTESAKSKQTKTKNNPNYSASTVNKQFDSHMALIKQPISMDPSTAVASDVDPEEGNQEMISSITSSETGSNNIESKEVKPDKFDEQKKSQQSTTSVAIVPDARSQQLAKSHQLKFHVIKKNETKKPDVRKKDFNKNEKLNQPFPVAKPQAGRSAVRKTKVVDPRIDNKNVKQKKIVQPIPSVTERKREVKAEPSEKPNKIVASRPFESKNQSENAKKKNVREKRWNPKRRTKNSNTTRTVSTRPTTTKKIEKPILRTDENNANKSKAEKVTNSDLSKKEHTKSVSVVKTKESGANATKK